MEHLAGRCAVDVSAVFEDFGAPGFSGEMGQDPRLDGAEVGHDDFFPFLRNKGGSDQFGQNAGDRRVEEVQRFVISALYQFPCFVQIFHVVLRQVLQLDEPACPSAAPVGSIELEHAPTAPVLTDGILHGFIFLHAALRGLQP